MLGLSAIGYGAISVVQANLAAGGDFSVALIGLTASALILWLVFKVVALRFRPWLVITPDDIRLNSFYTNTRHIVRPDFRLGRFDIAVHFKTQHTVTGELNFATEKLVTRIVTLGRDGRLAVIASGQTGNAQIDEIARCLEDITGTKVETLKIKTDTAGHSAPDYRHWGKNWKINQS